MMTPFGTSRLNSWIWNVHDAKIGVFEHPALLSFISCRTKFSSNFISWDIATMSEGRVVTVSVTLENGCVLVVYLTVIISVFWGWCRNQLPATERYT